MLSNQFWNGFLLGAFLVLIPTLLIVVLMKARAARNPQ
jgi:hypothetical protein